MQPNITDAIDLFLDDHTVTAMDSSTGSLSRSFVDAVNGSDNLTRQITDKRLDDTVRMNEWFTIKNVPQSDPWS